MLEPPLIYLWTALGYVVGMPLLLLAFTKAHKKLVVERAMLKAGKDRAALKNVPEPLWPRVKERLDFTMKDTRPLKVGKKEGAGPPHRMVYFGLLLAGLLVWTLTPLLGSPLFLLLGFLFFVAAMGFGVKASDDIIVTRANILRRMFEIGASKGVVSNEHSANPAAVIKILEWKDFVKPQKVEYQVRTEFGFAGEESFLQQFNQVFGNETAWVPSDDAETGAPGWNYDKGTVTLHAVPPLPTMAKWSEHYVLDPAIAWSFFPIALGVENGVELTNPETGQIEYVLGFDVAGEQAKVGKKAGVKVSPTITTSPMCFTGDTLLPLATGGSITFEEAFRKQEPIPVWSLNEKNEQVEGILSSVMLTRRGAEVYRYEFSDGGHIRCTPDHLLRLTSGEYKEAQELTSADSLAGYNQKELSLRSSSFEGYFDVYDGGVAVHHNFAVLTKVSQSDEFAETFAAGLFAHNCFVGGGTGGGKSLSVNTKIVILDEAADDVR